MKPNVYRRLCQSVSAGSSRLPLLRRKRAVIAGMVAAMFAAPVGAAVIYQDWQPPSSTGNYQLTVTAVGTSFNWQLTVNPWNAEALGLFVDFGDVEIPNTFTTAGITNISTTPTVGVPVTLFAQDTAAGDCGPGCNLNGSPLEPLAVPDAQWELVFRLGAQGFDGVQTWNFTTPDFGLTEADFGIVAIRAQQLCPADTTLPGGIENCGGSEKVWAGPNGELPPSLISAPGSLALLGAGLLALGVTRRKSNNQEPKG